MNPHRALPLLATFAFIAACPESRAADDFWNSAFPGGLSCGEIRARQDQPLPADPFDPTTDDASRTPPASLATRRYELKRIGLSQGLTNYGAEDSYSGEDPKPFDLANQFAGAGDIDAIEAGSVSSEDVADGALLASRIFFRGACSDRWGSTRPERPEATRTLTRQVTELAPGCTAMAWMSDGGKIADAEDVASTQRDFPGDPRVRELAAGDFIYTRVLWIVLGDPATPNSPHAPRCREPLRQLQAQVEGGSAGPFWRAMKDHGLVDFRAFEDLRLAILTDAYLGKAR